MPCFLGICSIIHFFKAFYKKVLSNEALELNSFKIRIENNGCFEDKILNRILCCNWGINNSTLLRRKTWFDLVILLLLSAAWVGISVCSCSVFFVFSGFLGMLYWWPSLLDGCCVGLPFLFLFGKASVGSAGVVLKRVLLCESFVSQPYNSCCILLSFLNKFYDSSKKKKKKKTVEVIGLCNIVKCCCNKVKCYCNTLQRNWCYYNDFFFIMTEYSSLFFLFFIFILFINAYRCGWDMYIRIYRG